MADILASLLRIPAAVALDVADDGTVLVAADGTGTDQLYRTDLAGGPLLQLTAQAEPVHGLVVPGTSRVLASMDHGGDERHQLYVLDEPLDALQPLVVDHAYLHRLGGISRDGRRIVYATNRRNGVDFDVIVRDLRDGSERVVFDRGGSADAAGFSPDGRWVTVMLRSAEKSMDDDLYLCGIESGEVIHITPHEDDATFGDPAWLHDSSGMIVANDAGRDTMVLSRWDLRTRSWDAGIEVGWECGCWSDRGGTRLLLAVNEDGHTVLRMLDMASLEALADIPTPEPGVAWRPGMLPEPRISADGRQVVFSFSSPRRPSGVWVTDSDGRNLRCLGEAPPREVPAESCVMPELHRIASFDGEEIPAFLYRPASDGAGPPPVVVHIHGGPEGQASLLWNPVIQAFVARGYAVVAPNVRGSTGYGKRYAHLDDVRLRLDSVRDLAAIHAWLPSAGLDQRRAVLYGGSYGGYMVLCGLAFQPELWAAGVDIVGMSSLVTFLENTSAWRRAVREREYGRLDRDRDFLVAASPLTHVEQMRAPLFILHGANDPRVPLSEAEQLHAVLRGKGVPTELLVYGDEGHGLSRRDNRLDAYPRIFEFLDRVLAAPVGAMHPCPDPS